VGYDADLTLVDMKRRETIRNSWIALILLWQSLRARPEHCGLARG
jgi:hypothetical protein